MIHEPLSWTGALTHDRDYRYLHLRAPAGALVRGPRISSSAPAAHLYCYFTPVGPRNEIGKRTMSIGQCPSIHLGNEKCLRCPGHAL